MRKIGYAHVTLDLQGYRRGSVNETPRASLPSNISLVFRLEIPVQSFDKFEGTPGGDAGRSLADRFALRYLQDRRAAR